MRALALAALLSAQPPDETLVRVKLEALTLADAERLDGKAVVATFVAGKPAFTWGAGRTLRTVTAPRGEDGSTERTVVLRGNRLSDADLGAKLTLVGTLRVIRHKPSVIGDKEFIGFTEIRIEEP